MGTELDPKFRIRAPLRCDGVGSLDCAEDTQSGMRLAIRWLPVDANGEAAVKAVEEMPRHPVLPRIRQTGRVGSSAYVAMDFPDGRLLATMVGVEVIPAEHVARMGAAIADALAILHGQAMVHGELSADSVLMLPEGKAILWDVPLVLANRLTDRRGEERALAQLIKVAPYLSPERARGLPASAPSDIYALGAVMCIAGGGELPPGGTTLAVVHQVANGQWTPELPRAMSPAVRALVKRMIQADPLSRPTAKQVADDLAVLLDRTPTIPEMRAVVLPPPLPAKTPAGGMAAARASSSGVRPVVAPSDAARSVSSSGIRRAVDVVVSGAEPIASTSGVQLAIDLNSDGAAPARDASASASGNTPAINPSTDAASVGSASSSGIRPVIEPSAAAVLARTASSSGIRPAIDVVAAMPSAASTSTSDVRPVIDPGSSAAPVSSGSQSGGKPATSDQSVSAVGDERDVVSARGPAENVSVSAAVVPTPRVIADQPMRSISAEVALTPASVVLERTLAAEAQALSAAEAKKRWMFAGAGIVSVCALLVAGLTIAKLASSGTGHVAESPAPTAATTTSTESVAANARAEDVSDFVAPLVKQQRAGEASFRPAASEKTSARPHPSAHPAPAAPSVAAERADGHARAGDEHDFSFLPSNEEAPHTELKRPSF